MIDLVSRGDVLDAFLLGENLSNKEFVKLYHKIHQIPTAFYKSIPGHCCRECKYFKPYKNQPCGRCTHPGMFEPRIVNYTTGCCKQKRLLEEDEWGNLSL